MAWLPLDDRGSAGPTDDTPVKANTAMGSDIAPAARSTPNMEDPGALELVDTKGSAPGVTEGQVYRTYKRRWFGLVQLVLLNVVVSWDVRIESPVALPQVIGDMMSLSNLTLHS